MAKGSGSTKKSTSSNPKGISSGGVKITSDFTGAKFAEGVTHSNGQISSVMSKLYPGIVTGGGLNSIGFQKDTPDSVINSYVKDVKVLNKFYSDYKQSVNSLPNGLSRSERLKKELTLMEQFENNIESYYKKRKK